MDDLFMQQTEVSRCREDVIQGLDHVLQIDLRQITKFANKICESADWRILDQERAQYLWKIVLLNACGQILSELEETMQMYDAGPFPHENYFIDKIYEAIDAEFGSFENVELIKTVWGIGKVEEEEEDVGT